METEEEWAFINSQIQRSTYLEWYISLRNEKREWKWISNHSLTLDKWQRHEPSDDGDCVVMAKRWPLNERGLFNDLPCPLRRAYICEYSDGNYLDTTRNVDAL
jgi:hypothetical protein